MQPELRRLAVVLLASAALVGGCGEDDANDDATPGTTTTAVEVTPQANAAYERGFSDCSSVTLKRLAAKYKVKQNVSAVAQAVGDAWANELGGGESTAAYGEAGCKEAFKTRTGAA